MSGAFSICEIVAIVRGSNADTIIARAFRRALGLDSPQSRGAVTARRDRYQGARRLMNQRYGVRM